MFHHDSRNYQVAASEAARIGRQKLEEIIHKSIASAQSVIEQIQSRDITDTVVDTPDIRVEHVSPENWNIFTRKTGNLLLHKHAYRQILADTGVPVRFADDLSTQRDILGNRWGAYAITQLINTILAHRTKQRNLIRCERDTVKGFLSDRYRRIDSRPLLESFIAASQQIGLIPISGISSDTKCRVRAILPHVFEPVENEILTFGLEWGNSDYGDGGHVVNLWTMRVWCTNTAITESCLRQIHLGKRLADNIAYSEQTYQLDTAANASALKDVVLNAIGPDRVNLMLNSIRQASQEEITGQDVGNVLKKYLEKADAERVVAIYNSPDETNVPPGQNLWRLSNAISWLAQAKEFSADKRLELESIAGQILPGDRSKALCV